VTTLGPSTTPGTYEWQVLDSLHDPNANRWSLPQIDFYVNQARKRLCMDTACLRILQPTFCTGGQEQYVFGQVGGASIASGGTGYTAPTVAFSGGGGSGVAATLGVSGGAVNAITLTNFGSGYSSAPTATISDSTGTGAAITTGVVSVASFDLLSINLLWGTERYTLDWKSFRIFSPSLRPFLAASYQRQPVAWALYGQTGFYLGPTPDQTYGIEADTAILPIPFATGDTTTVDAISSANQDPIAYYACHLAKFNAQNYGEAEQWMGKYTERLTSVIASYTGRIPSVYG
jgi:hypothetical protein